MNISLKETNETEYWFRIFKDTRFIDKHLFKRMHSDCKKLIAMLVATIKTSKIYNTLNYKHITLTFSLIPFHLIICFKKIIYTN